MSRASVRASVRNDGQFNVLRLRVGEEVSYDYAPSRGLTLCYEIQSAGGDQRPISLLTYSQIMVLVLALVLALGLVLVLVGTPGDHRTLDAH